MKLFSCTNEWNILPFVLLSAWYTRTVLGMHFAESSKENIISSAKGLLQEQPPENILITKGRLGPKPDDSAFTFKSGKRYTHVEEQKTSDIPDPTRVPKFDRIEEKISMLYKQNNFKRNMHLDDIVRKDLLVYLNNIKNKAIKDNLPTLDAELGTIFTLLALKLRGISDNNITLKISATFETLSEKILSKIFSKVELKEDDLLKYKILSEMVTVLMALFANQDYLAIQSLVEGKNVIRLLASELNFITRNKLELLVLDKSYIDFFLKSKATENFHKILNYLKSEKTQEKLHSLLE
ncbi:hypothetical protein BY996DRAFT_7081012 [Phakopsora pachyrhizi]|nr:hypothetical protein BY996DRAFT_7081012 [Phakopsora pachyrhizi]